MRPRAACGALRKQGFARRRSSWPGDFCIRRWWEWECGSRSRRKEVWRNDVAMYKYSRPSPSHHGCMRVKVFIRSPSRPRWPCSIRAQVCSRSLLTIPVQIWKKPTNTKEADKYRRSSRTQNKLKSTEETDETQHSYPGMAANTVCLFMRRCSRSLFTAPVQI